MTTNNRIIRVVAYDPMWPKRYQGEREAIAAVLGDEIVHAHHIGSTAVPGLAAKPTIDILLEVKDVNALDEYNAQIKELGYIPKGEYGIPGRRFYKKDLPNPTHHIHAFDAGSDEAAGHIAFRDYLIAYPKIAQEYEELKKRCARDCDNDIEKYMAMKHDFIKVYVEKAWRWTRDR